MNTPICKVLIVVVLSCVPFANAGDAHRAPALPHIAQRVFSISNYGAASSETTDNAQAIQKTIDAAAASGGGIVEVPAGEYLSGPFRLVSGIEFRIDAGATLKMLPMDRYPGGTTNPQSFISGQKLHDVAISGKGAIDGQGAAWWPLVKKQSNIARPRMIALSGCDKILIENIRLQNSPMFHIAISGHSTNVTVRGVTIRPPRPIH